MDTAPTYNAELWDQDQLRRRLDGLHRLFDVTRVLAAEIDANKVLSTIVQEISKAMECERAGIYLYDPKQNELYPAVAAGIAPGETMGDDENGRDGGTALDAVAVDDSQLRDVATLVSQIDQTADSINVGEISEYDEESVLDDPIDSEGGTSILSSKSQVGALYERIPLGKGVSGHVAQTRKLCNVPDPSRDPKWSRYITKTADVEIRNLLAAPMLSASDGGLLGVLELVNKRTGEFDAADEELISAFSDHAAVALDRAHMVEQLKVRQEIETALGVARRIQRTFIPSTMPPMPGYEAATWSFPHQAVGGDYCDLIPIGANRVALCIADVSGHGIGPSLTMASVRAALRALTLEHSSAQILLELMNQSLANDLRAGGFVTIALAILDFDAHRMEFSNAGHCPALLYQSENDRFVNMEATGVPLGVLDDTRYPLGPPLAMKPGDWLILGTDGLIEAMDIHGEMFGIDRLKRAVRENVNTTPRQMTETIGRMVNSHFPSDSPEDDLTLLVVKRV
jgi:sigma-B regulation protein RsbU (phosphoserine phosphatase)